MATTQLSYTNLPPNSGVVNPTGTTLVAAPTNDMQLKDAVPEQTVLRVANTDNAAPLTITVKAGDHPPALAAGQGDLGRRGVRDHALHRPVRVRPVRPVRRLADDHVVHDDGHHRGPEGSEEHLTWQRP